MAPVPCSTMGASAARVARSALKKFICMAHSNSSSLVPRKPCRRRRTAPTLFTSTSTRPWSSMARWTSRAGPSDDARSIETAVTRSRPARLSVLRAPATTRAPSSTSARVTARPMPLLAPVTIAILLAKLRSMMLLCPVFPLVRLPCGRPAGANPRLLPGRCGARGQTHAVTDATESVQRTDGPGVCEESGHLFRWQGAREGEVAHAEPPDRDLPAGSVEDHQEYGGFAHRAG